MKKILLPMLAVALLTLPVMRTAVAADNEGSKPVAVLAIASYERLMTDIAFIGNLTGNPDLDKNLEGMIELFTQGQGLAGLDKKRPLGIALNTDGLQFQPLVILPVTDLKQLLTALEGLVGAAEEGAGGVYQLDVFGQQIFIKENNKWAYISMSPEVLDHLPKDGAALFDGLEKNYDIAGRLHVQNVPEVFRTMLIDQLRQGVSAGLARQDGESDDAFEARKKMVDSQIDSLTKVINDLEQLTLGISLDPAAKTAKVDLSFTAVAGTDSAKQFASAKPTTSSFAGFLTPDAAASLNLTTQLAEKDAAQFVSGLEALRTQALEHITSSENLPDEASKKLAQEITGQVFDAIKKTFETGKIDAGAVLNLSDKSMALVVGAYVADPKGLEDALRKFAKLGESDPKFPKVNFNASEHAGIDFHTASIPVPADRKVSKVLGEKLDVAVGIGEKTVYLALGTDSLALAKQVIDRSKSAASKQVPPFQLNVALTPIFQFAAALQENDAKDDAKDDGKGDGKGDDKGDDKDGTDDDAADGPDLKGMVDDLAKAPGKDHVRLEYVPQANGATLRLTAEEGALLLLGSALKNMQASGAIPGLGP